MSKKQIQYELPCIQHYMKIYHKKITPAELIFPVKRAYQQNSLPRKDINISTDTLRLEMIGSDINFYQFYELLEYIVDKYQSLDILKGDIYDVRLKSWCGETALMTAVKRNDKKIVEFLIKKYVDNNYPLNEITNFNDTSLILASYDGNHEIVKLLVDAYLRTGCSLDDRDITGSTALLWAVIKGFNDIAKLLIGANSSIDISNYSGDTVLSIAKKNNNYGIVSIISKKNVVQ